MKFASKLKVQLPLALGLSLISIYSTKLSANCFDQPTTPLATTSESVPASPVIPSPTNSNVLAIRNIYINESKQLVIEFDNPTHLNPVEPQVKDYPGLKHDIVLEFPGTTFAVDKAPKAKLVLESLSKVYPDLNSIAYATALDGKKARIRIGVSASISAHPSLVKIDQDVAIINLDLPEKTAIAANSEGSNDKDKSIAGAGNADGQQVATATPVVAKESSDTSIKTKATKSIKSAWSSGLSKLKPLSKLGHNKTDQPGVVANNTPPVTITEKPADVKKAEESPADQPTTKIDLVAALNSNSPIENAAETANPISTPAVVNISSGINKAEIANLKPEINPEINPVINADQNSTGKDPSGLVSGGQASDVQIANGQISPAKDTIVAKATPVIADNTAETKPLIEKAAVDTKAEEIKTAAVVKENPIANNDQVIANNPIEAKLPIEAKVTEVKTEENKAASDSAKDNQEANTSVTSDTGNKTEAAKPLAGDEPNKISEEPIVTPLSVEQVLKEKAQTVTEPKPTVAAVDNSPPLSIETNGDKSTVSDFKTGFSKPEEKSTDTDKEIAEKKDLAGKISTEEKKEETEKIASVPPNPLDSLTNAAINNNANNGSEENTGETNQQVSPAVKLKVQKAHVGGKDYFPPKFADDAVDHYNAAVRAHLNGKLTEAITEYQAAIEADEKIGEAYSNLGLIYNQLHKYDKAMIEFHKALAINPKDAITYNGIGAAMRAKSNLLAAIKNWQTAITLDPNLASAHYNLGTAYELNKDLEKALAQYKEAVKHDDKLGEAYYRMGLILQKMNNKNLAMEEYKQAIKISQQASYATDAKRRITLLSQSKNNSM